MSSVGIVLMSHDNEDRKYIDGIKSLDKKEQIDVLRSLLQQLEPEVIKEASQDAAIQFNLGSNNTNGNQVTHSEFVFNLYFGDNDNDLQIISTVLDAAAHRLRKNKKTEPID